MIRKAIIKYKMFLSQYCSSVFKVIGNSERNILYRMIAFLIIPLNRQSGNDEVKKSFITSTTLVINNTIVKSH